MILALTSLALIGAALAYGAAAARMRREGRDWPAWRTAAFTAGNLIALTALAPPVEVMAEASFRAHAAQHVALGMIAPVALVAAAPVTLALRTLPRPHRRRVATLLAGRGAHLLTHPGTALVLAMGGLYALHLTPLLAVSRESTAVHVVVHAHVFLAGVLLAWAVLRPDPAPRTPSPATRVGALAAAAALHAVLAKLVYAHGLPAGSGYAPDDVRAGAQLMFYGGDVAEVLLAALLLTAVVRGRARRERRRLAWTAASRAPVDSSTTRAGLPLGRTV